MVANASTHAQISGDLVFSVLSIPRVLLDILPNFVPYALVLGGFGGFVLWNGGIVLGKIKLLPWNPAS